jgi:hypothetical protein
MSKCGNNKTSVHWPVMLTDDPDCVQAYCSKCKARVFIRRDDKKKYREFFRRDTLQQGTNLHAREYPQRMKIVR